MGSGGPRSRYADHGANGWQSGSRDNVIPLTDDEAYKWLEDNDEVTVIEEYFSESIENA